MKISNNSYHVQSYYTYVQMYVTKVVRRIKTLQFVILFCQFDESFNALNFSKDSEGDIYVKQMASSIQNMQNFYEENAQFLTDFPDELNTKFANINKIQLCKDCGEIVDLIPKISEIFINDVKTSFGEKVFKQYFEIDNKGIIKRSLKYNPIMEDSIEGYNGVDKNLKILCDIFCNVSAIKRILPYFSPADSQYLKHLDQQDEFLSQSKLQWKTWMLDSTQLYLKRSESVGIMAMVDLLTPPNLTTEQWRDIMLSANVNPAGIAKDIGNSYSKIQKQFASFSFSLLEEITKEFLTKIFNDRQKLCVSLARRTLCELSAEKMELSEYMPSLKEKALKIYNKEAGYEEIQDEAIVLCNKLNTCRNIIQKYLAINSEFLKEKFSNFLSECQPIFEDLAKYSIMIETTRLSETSVLQVSSPNPDLGRE